MKIATLASVSILVGLCLGLGSTWAKHGWSVNIDSPALPATVPAQVIVGPPGKITVDHEEFNFGTIERDETVKHQFIFSNTGDGWLELTKGGTSCMKCTIADLAKSRLAPGESTTVSVSYHADVPDREFRQTASIIVKGDPLRERVALTVYGNITSSFRLTSSAFVLSKFSVNETKTAETRLYANLSKDLQITEKSFTNPDFAEFFDVAVEPIPPDELAKEPNAKSGLTVAVTVKPGLPLGPIRQKLHLETNLERNSVFDLPIEGIVDSDLSIIGRGWNAEEAVLELGTVRSAEGDKRTLDVTIRGPFRHDVKLSVGKTNEPTLQVTIGEKREINGGAVIQIPVAIEIPPGAPSVNHLGGAQGKLAKVMLETTHPQAKQLQIYVQFAVEN